jgi:hypothetical protein
MGFLCLEDRGVGLVDRFVDGVGDLVGRRDAAGTLRRGAGSQQSGVGLGIHFFAVGAGGQHDLVCLVLGGVRHRTFWVVIEAAAAGAGVQGEVLAGIAEVVFRISSGHSTCR